MRLDDVDLKVLLALIKDPRIQISELADEVGVARNTAQSRLRRLQRAE
ncbi:transcriptional regulator, partial [Escherichia coli]|nr:transcriptional regulator [Escherichia coli]